MFKGKKIIWKFYAFMFSTIALANLVWLLHPESEPYIFYKILMTWGNTIATPHFTLQYYAAVVKSLITIVCLYPLFAFAFDQNTKHLLFWQWMLVVRVIMECLGNYYELVYIKSAYHMVLGYGLSVTGAFVLPLLPSYAAHFIYAFPKSNSNAR